MDVSVREELSGLVEEMTHSGSPSLDHTQLKKLKTICRSSDINVRTIYELVMSNLSKKHAEVRLSAFQIVCELFPRSHLFRLLVASDFQQLAELVTGTESKRPLPPPRSAAARLKETSLLAIRQWNEQFGDGYPKLKLGYNYLKYNKKVDFGRLVAQTEAVRRQTAVRDARRAAIAQQRLSEVHAEMADQKYDIDSCLKQMDSCFDLLLPRFDAVEETQLSENLLTPIGGQGEFRDRVPSSGDSFVSLGSSKSEADMEGGEVAMQTESNSTTNVSVQNDQSAPSNDGTGGKCVAGVCEGEGEGGEKGEGKGEAEDEGGEKGRKKGVDIGRQGKGKGRAVVERSGEGGDVSSERGDSGEGGDVSSDESDVEWVEVEPIHMASLTPMRQNSLIGPGLSIPIHLPVQISVEENEDNASILEALSESHHLLQDKYLPSVNKWLQWLTKAGGETDLKEAIDIKSKILEALHKYKRLNIRGVHLGEKVVQDQCPKNSVSPSHSPPPPPSQPSHPPPITTTSTAARLRGGGSLHTMNDVELEQDPTTIQAQLGAIRRKNSSAQALASVASTSPADRHPPPAPKPSSSGVPVVPFDMDLYHWNNPDGKPLSVNKVCMSSVHQYWGSERDIELCEEERALLKCRTIQFAGKFEPVKWSCRAPLPSGKLCPRRDRFKCPFHGPIIPRDESGNPAHTTSNTTTTTSTITTTTTTTPHTITTTPHTITTTTATPPSSGISDADYNDIEAAVFAAKGIALTQKGKGKKGKRGGRRKKYPGLTDISAHNNTPRKRLERQIFSKRAVKKVASAMDAANSKRFRDKFGDTFNYALEQ